MRRRTDAYTLVEALLAAAILLVAVAAAAALAAATAAQEEMNARIARCVNLHEQAVRLYQLGLGGATISRILPRDPAVTAYPDFTSPAATAIGNLGTVEIVQSRLTYATSDSSERTSAITAVRPSIR